MRVLHIIQSLNHGAVENWLVRMLRHARTQGRILDWTFYCTLPSAGSLESEAAALGARVINSPVPIADKVAFIGALRQELRGGKYDVLHCHHDLLSAVYLLAGMGLPVGLRLVHVHNADEALPTPYLFKRILYREPMRRVCLKMTDRVVGISNHTLDTFLAGRSRRAGRDVVLYYGVDPKSFENTNVDRHAFRNELGLAGESRILLFAGRIVPEKNPLFAIDVLAEMHHLDPMVVGVFVGSGSLSEAVERRAHEHGLAAAFRTLGWRDDVPDIMCCCDWFILPRPEAPMEGFGLAVVEAQLAGLRLLLSQGVPDDPLLPTAIFRRLPLVAGPRAWALAAMELLQGPSPRRADALAALKQSPMDMDCALGKLLKLYV